MSSNHFPSGPWTGFYNHRPGDNHRMDLRLQFNQGWISGDGMDDVGRFLIAGEYDEDLLECRWTKSYVGAHDVQYRGFREGKGVWGTWEIRTWHLGGLGPFVGTGGFQIWPVAAGEASEAREAEDEEAMSGVTPASEPATVELRRPG